MPKPNEHPHRGRIKRRALSRRELRVLLRAFGCIHPVPDARQHSQRKSGYSAGDLCGSH
jgi:hypothetical protein